MIRESSHIVLVIIIYTRVRTYVQPWHHGWRRPAAVTQLTSDFSARALTDTQALTLGLEVALAQGFARVVL